jgi:hypothetical protein
MSAFIADNMPSFIDSVFRKETCSLTFDSSKLSEMELNNVRMGHLVDINLQLTPFEMKPAFETIEKDLKQAFLDSIIKLGNIPSVLFDESLLKENFNYCFDVAQDHLADSFRLLDEFLAEAAMPLVAFMYCMQSFAHLMTDKEDLLKEELKQLLNDVVLHSSEHSGKPRAGGLPHDRRQQDLARNAKLGSCGHLLNRYLRNQVLNQEQCRKSSEYHVCAPHLQKV